MIDHKLIERVVAEVLKQLTLSDKKTLEKSQPHLLVVGDHSRLDSNVLQTIESKWHIISYHSYEDISIHTPKKVLFLEASQDLIVKGALGISDTSESELLARCLLEKIPVTLIPATYLSSYLLDDIHHNTEYISQLRSYKERLVKFGISVESLVSFIEQSITNDLNNHSQEQRTKKRKLLTQRDVQFYKGNQIHIDHQTIITPLARDTAREKGITINVMDVKGENS
jgi:hypothetical protein